MATSPVAAIALALVSIKLAPAVEGQKRELTTASKHAMAAITNIDTVKVFNAQDQEIWQYYSSIKKAATQYLLQARYNALQFGITKFLVIAIFVQGFWYGIHLVNRGELAAGHVLTCFYACLNAIQGIEVILPQWLVLKKGMSAGQTLKSLMVEMDPYIKDASIGGSLRPEICRGDVEFSSVSTCLSRKHPY